VTFGEPISLAGFDPESRRDLVTLTHRVWRDVGRLYKVLPTALVAAAARRQMTRRQLVDRVDDMLAILIAEGANLAVKTGARAVDEGLAHLSSRGVLMADGDRIRVRDRIVLRYYARTIQHLLGHARTTH
jgi:hypothetical protein